MPLVFPIPPLSTSFAHLLTFFFASSYVGSLYISKFTRLSFSSQVNPTQNGGVRRKEIDERWRDDPDVIRARLAAVIGATILCCAGLLGVLWHLVGDGINGFDAALETTFVRIGLNPDMDWVSLFPHLVTPVLFIGPLYARYVGGSLPFQRDWTFREDFVLNFISWQGARNYVLGPITEEIVFRACVLAVYHLSGASKMRMIFLGPLSFGLAHIHHAWDTYNRYGRTPAAAKRAVIMSLFQLTYTTLFGFHCSYLFLRTGSVLPPISAHVFCNIMGIPQISFELRRFPHRKGAIIAAYVLGIIGFVFSLGRWTRTQDSLYWRDNTNHAGHATY